MNKNRAKVIFLLPAVAWVLIFTVFPLIFSAWVSFHSLESKVEVTREKVAMLDDAGNPVLSRSGKPRTRTIVETESISIWTFEGAKNFTRIFKDRQSLVAVRTTAIFVVVAVSIQLVLGMALAVLFNRKLPARGLLRSVMLLPIFATPIAVGYLFFTIFFENGGPLNNILAGVTTQTGLAANPWVIENIPWLTGVPWLSNPTMALASVIIVDIWQWTPFAFLVFLAGLQSIDEEQLDAARLETESEWKIFFHIVLPLLQPIVVIVLLLRLAEALKLFDIPFALTGGGPGIATQSYVFFAFRTGLRFFDVGYAAALSYALLIVVMIIVTLSFNRLRQTYA